jgi:hypothetical protein
MNRFEDGLWEVELTEAAIKWFKRNKKKNPRLCQDVIKRLRTLARGYWNERNHKPLAGTRDVDLFEANLSKGQRILWEVAVNLSERLNSFEASSTTATATVHSEMIRVWAIVDQHDNLSREIKKVESSHRRGQTCLVQQNLQRISSSKGGASVAGRMTTRDEDGVVQRVPATFSVADTSSFNGAAAAADSKRHYHLGSSNPNDFALLKFYSINSHMLGCLFGDRGSESSLPFKMTSKEYEASTTLADCTLWSSESWVILNSVLCLICLFRLCVKVARLSHERPCGILLMGRSGTGKTSVQCYRLANDWVSYWRACAADGDPRLPVPPSRPRASEGAATEYPQESAQELSHLRQLFVTK